MNQILNFEFSEFNLITVLILGLLLLFVLRFIRRFFITRISKNHIKQLYQLSEIFIWIIYGFWSLQIVLKDSYYYMLAVLSICAIIIIWLAWFVAKDFIAGIVLKLADNYQPGQQFKLDNIQGIIVEADYLQLSVRMQDGIMVKIPYSKISGAIHYEARIDDKSSQHRFEIEVIKNYSIDEIRKRIRQAVLLSAGVSINKEPQINLKNETNDSCTFEMVVHAISPRYFQQIEGNVRSVFD